jgi:hypothetical protein
MVYLDKMSISTKCVQICILDLLPRKEKKEEKKPESTSYRLRIDLTLIHTKRTETHLLLLNTFESLLHALPKIFFQS